MRTLLLPLFAFITIFLYSCRPENFNPPQPPPVVNPALKYTITKNISGQVTNVAWYNAMELMIADTSYNSSNVAIGFTKNEYNSKGKLTRGELKFPAVFAGGYLWADDFTYQDDTLPVSNRHYLKGSQTALTKNIYNGAGQHIMDSTFHTSFTVGISKKEYTYDSQNRFLTDLTYNTTGDTTFYITYQYSANHTEKFTSSYSYNPVFINTSKTVTDYSATGKILLEKSYNSLNQLSTQIDYIYDATDRLLKKITTNSSSISEEQYFYNSYGRIDKVEYHTTSGLVSTKTYYYE